MDKLCPRPKCGGIIYAAPTKARNLYLLKCTKCDWHDLQESRRKGDIPIIFENRRKS